jgi:ABC-type nitrate/sulfonate/bicarbonate transport system permease component
VAEAEGIGVPGWTGNLGVGVIVGVGVNVAVGIAVAVAEGITVGVAVGASATFAHAVKTIATMSITVDRKCFLLLVGFWFFIFSSE